MKICFSGLWGVVICLPPTLLADLSLLHPQMRCDFSKFIRIATLIAFDAVFFSGTRCLIYRFVIIPAQPVSANSAYHSDFSLYSTHMRWRNATWTSAPKEQNARDICVSHRGISRALRWRRPLLRSARDSVAQSHHQCRFLSVTPIVWQMMKDPDPLLLSNVGLFEYTSVQVLAIARFH